MSSDVACVVGVDGTPAGWLAVRLRAGRFVEAVTVPTFAELLERYASADVIGIDIPIGLPVTGMRAADREARRLLGARGQSSVFLVPPRDVLEASTYPVALERCRTLAEPGVSRQAYALRRRILEVDGLVPCPPRVVEVHPEVSFHALNGGPLRHRKRSWNGLIERRRLLERAGIVLPDHLPEIGSAPADDVVDAAAAAWTAMRVARGAARCLPEPPPEDERGRTMAIWY